MRSNETSTNPSDSVSQMWPSLNSSFDVVAIIGAWWEEVGKYVCVCWGGPLSILFKHSKSYFGIGCSLLHSSLCQVSTTCFCCEVFLCVIQSHSEKTELQHYIMQFEGKYKDSRTKCRYRFKSQIYHFVVGVACLQAKLFNLPVLKFPNCEMGILQSFSKDQYKCSNQFTAVDSE